MKRKPKDPWMLEEAGNPSRPRSRKPAIRLSKANYFIFNSPLRSEIKQSLRTKSDEFYINLYYSAPKKAIVFHFSAEPLENYKKVDLKKKPLLCAVGFVKKFQISLNPDKFYPAETENIPGKGVCWIIYLKAIHEQI